MANELSAISFKLPTTLREKIKAQAAAEERTESGFLRFHLGKLFQMTDEETNIEDESAESGATEGGAQ